MLWIGPDEPFFGVSNTNLKYSRYLRLSLWSVPFCLESLASMNCKSFADEASLPLVVYYLVRCSFVELYLPAGGSAVANRRTQGTKVLQHHEGAGFVRLHRILKRRRIWQIPPHFQFPSCRIRLWQVRLDAERRRATSPHESVRASARFLGWHVLDH